MAKVTIHDTPTNQVIAKATSEVTVTDARGRQIRLKKPGVLAQYRLIDILGDSAKNQVYVGMCLPLIYVAAIDDDAVYQPVSRKEIDALIQRLDEDGIAAVTMALEEHFSGNQTPDEAKEYLKK